MVKNIVVNRFLLLLLVFVTYFTTNGYTQQIRGFKLKTIVIDPGHGDVPGAIYGQYKEKDITLKVGLMLRDKIKAKFPDINVICTRTTDIDVPLHRRSKMANQAAADIFISIHANSSTSASARGSETFLMGYDKSKQNLAVAMKENQVVTLEDNYKSEYEGFNPGSVESYIIFSLMQYSFLEQSSLLASLIQKEYAAHTPLPNRGVKQAPFLVLWQTSSPSVLTEIGFLSNGSDRAYITSKAGQNTIAQSIFNAICKYKEHVEWADDSPIASSQSAKVVNSSKTESVKGEKHKILFKVQVASSLKPIAITRQEFGSYCGSVEVVKIGNRYKYSIGGYNSYKEALSLQRKLRAEKFKDAFVVSFDDGKQIGVNEAIELTK